LFNKLFEKLSEVFDNRFYTSAVFWICVLTCLVLLFIRLLYVSRRKLQNAEYYLDVIRTVSKGLADTHEIAAFNGQGDVIYTTHPYSYSNKREFIRNLTGKVMASIPFKNFCKLLESNKRCGVSLSGGGSGLLNQFKTWAANTSVVQEEESSISEEVSVVTISDISKHFNETNKLLSNYEKLENFLDNFPFGVFYVDSIGKIMGANTTFANFVNSSKDRIIGVSIGDFIENFNPHQDLISQKTVLVTLKPKFSQAFGAILVRSTVSSISALQPWIIYKAAVDRNISTKSDNEFLEQETFSASPVPSLITAIDGNIVALNPAFAAMIQDKVILDRNKIMKPGTNILDFVQMCNPGGNLLEQLKQSSLSVQGSQPVEIKFSGGSNNIITMAYIGAVHQKPPRTKNETLLLIQFFDISGQKMLEQQFMRSQRIQAVGQLAGGVAHDFNNLLTAMIGFCDLLLQRYTPNDPSYGDVVQIKQNAGRAANLVRQLLAFSRQQTLKPSVVSITEILVDLSSLLRRLIGTNVEFQVTHGRDLWPVKLDANQFEQVIINLAINARDAMGDDGNLTIRTRNHFAEKEFKCIYDTAHRGDYVLIEVIDTGCGIDPNIIENIFEPFFSRKDPVSRTTSGTGLGLSTVYGIVNQTGGFICVDSEVGKGSNFKIYLPRYTGSEKIQVQKQEHNSRDLSGSETILLVEDEDAVRMFSARALRDKGYKVFEASGGEEAIEISKSNIFDLLVTDVVMPKIDGPTLSKILRESIKDLKTIFISGYTEDTFRQNVGKNSNIHFLQKPFTLKDLATKVKEVLS
jgi:two-component system cell cycle sensor histidine kinase/response regulator CckA